YEFQRVTPTGLIKATNSQVITLSPEGYHPIRFRAEGKKKKKPSLAPPTPSPPAPPSHPHPCSPAPSPPCWPTQFYHRICDRV
ncbi:unnamed protein product, partial [Sphagnum jensenii]